MFSIFVLEISAYIYIYTHTHIDSVITCFRFPFHAKNDALDCMGKKATHW
jgi:hypothetical protein